MSSELNQTRLLFEHASKLLTSSSLEEIAEHSLDIIEKVIQAELSSFQLVEGDKLTMLLNRPLFLDFTIPLDGPGVTAHVARTRKPMLIENVDEVEYFRPGGIDTKSELAVPILVDDNLFGVLNIEDSRPKHYGQHTLDLMEALASQIAIAVKSVKRFQGMKSIQSYTRDFILRDSFEDIAELTFNVLGETMDVFYGSFHVVEGDIIREIYTVGFTLKPFHQHIESDGVIPRAYRSKETQIIDDVKLDPDFNDDPIPEGVTIQSELAVPIIHEEKVIAVINLEDQNLAQYTVDDQTIVEIIADVISVWYENKILHEKNLSSQVVETRYRSLYEHSPIAIMTFSVLGFVTSCNQTTVDLTGYPRDQIVGKHAAQLSYFKPKEVPSLLKRLYSVIKGDNVGHVEFEYITLQGEERWAKGLGRLIKKPSGGHEVLIHVEDITDSKKRQQERLLYETQIAEEKIRSEHAIEMDRIKTNFVSTATHEIRTPLTAIIGYMELITAAVNEEKFSDITSYFETLKRNVRRLSLLTDNLLDLQRFQKNRVVFNAEEISIKELVDEALNEVTPLNKEKKLRIHSILRLTNQNINADRIRLHQVLVNLLNNAIKFSPPESTASVTVVEDEHRYTFSVADQGIGLEENEIRKLFEPFPDIHPNLKGRGTGIGLSICKGNIELHGGRIWAESKGQGKGSTFRFTIPKPD